MHTYDLTPHICVHLLERRLCSPLSFDFLAFIYTHTCKCDRSHIYLDILVTKGCSECRLCSPFYFDFLVFILHILKCDYYGEKELHSKNASTPFIINWGEAKDGQTKMKTLDRFLSHVGIAKRGEEITDRTLYISLVL